MTGSCVAAARRRAVILFPKSSSLSEGDIVVHVDHGIGRFVGLKTIEALGAPHDCLELRYAGDDKLFLPVENIELLSRYGSEDAAVQLDKLGGVAWQSRKAKLKKQLLEIAGQLIRIAAERALRTTPPMTTPEGIYGEFEARFPYDETEDQMSAIDAVLGDLASGTPMDQTGLRRCGLWQDRGCAARCLCCGNGRKAGGGGCSDDPAGTPTLQDVCRTFSRTARQNCPGIAPGRCNEELSETRKGIADGTLDIVIGTHALLGRLGKV